MERIFVYGSLRRGAHNNIEERFPGARFIVEAWVLGNLYILTGYPGLIVAERATEPLTKIVGEIFEVDELTLQQLDQFESIDEREPERGDYWRRLVDVTATNGENHTVWVYECNPAVWHLDQQILSGDWLQWVQQHNL